MASELAKRIIAVIMTAAKGGLLVEGDQLERLVDAQLPAPRPERVRVLRLLEYTGTREQIEEQLQTGAFPGGTGVKTFPRRDGSGMSIASVVLTQWPEVLASSRAEIEDSYGAEITKLRDENNRIRRAMAAFGDDAVKILSEIK